MPGSVSFGNFDGKSFLLDKDRVYGNMFRTNRISTWLSGYTDTQLSHTMNVFFKLAATATGDQAILGYGAATYNGSYVVFFFEQIGDTNEYIPKITTTINADGAKQIMTLPTITTNQY